MKARFAMPLIALGFLVVFFACSSMDDDTLAMLDGNAISLEEFTNKNPQARFADKDNDYIDSRVDEFVRRALFTQVALERKLDADSKIQEKKLSVERRQLLQYVYDRAILDEVVTDKLLQELYDRSGKEINARHILVQFEGGSRSQSDRTKTAALALMGQIKNRLAGGESFEALASEFTDDPTGKENGGDLGWFGWGKMVGAFQETAFELNPEEVSDVVETPFGFHIIKLVAIKNIERGSFDEEKAALKNSVRRSMGQELSLLANQFLDDQKKKVGFELIPENISNFYMIFAASKHMQEPMDKVFKKIGYVSPLFMLHGEPKGGNWIVDELKYIDDSQKPRFATENQFITILDQLVTQSLIVDYGYAMEYEKESAFTDKINVMFERFAYDAFIAREINENMEPSDDDLLEFYETNKSQKYMEKKKVQVRELFVKDSLLAVDLKKRVDAGELIDLLAGRYTERKSTKDKRGELPPFQEGRYGLMGKKAFSMAINDIAGPIKLGNGYSIIKLENIIPEGPKPFDSVKGRIRSEVVGDLRSKKMNSVYAELKKDHSVKINYAAARAYYSEPISD